MVAVTQDAVVTVPDGLGWLLAERAAERLAGVTHVRATGFVAGPRGAWDLPTRQQVATAIVDGAPAVVHGRATVERVAERRWLAWFPRPVGPRHAINVGGPSVVALARRPGLELVRSHLVVRSWQAELLQATANLARTGIGTGLVERWVERGRDVDDAAVRWACVVEATAHDRELVRAWAHGWAPIATAAALVDRLGPDVAETADVRDTRAVLDDVTRATDSRWSLTGPHPR